MAKLLNAKVYYGLHFAPGVAEYEDEPGKPYRILIEPDVMRRMDPTMNGNPLFVEHVEKVDFSQKESDGRVVESFFNPPDGMHWAKFLVDTEEADRAIANGWTLSNAYSPVFEEVPGRWHNVDYLKKLVEGKFAHLALVPNPRYAESKILTPDQFKEYNERKEQELKALKNSAGEKTMIKIFGVSILKNAEEILSSSVELPKSKKTMTIQDVVNALDEHMTTSTHKQDDDDMADLGHKVKLHDGSMCNVGELLERHKTMNDELAAMKTKYDELSKAVEEHHGHEGKDDDDKTNEETPEEKAAREKKEKEEKDKNDDAAKKHNAILAKVKTLKNAGPQDLGGDKMVENTVVVTNTDKLKRGSELFGA